MLLKNGMTRYNCDLVRRKDKVSKSLSRSSLQSYHVTRYSHTVIHVVQRSTRTSSWYHNIVGWFVVNCCDLVCYQQYIILNEDSSYHNIVDDLSPLWPRLEVISDSASSPTFLPESPLSNSIPHHPHHHHNHKRAISGRPISWGKGGGARGSVWSLLRHQILFQTQHNGPIDQYGNTVGITDPFLDLLAPQGSQ